MLSSVLAYGITLGAVIGVRYLIGKPYLTESTTIWVAIFCLLSNYCLEKAERQNS